MNNLRPAAGESVPEPSMRWADMSSDEEEDEEDDVPVAHVEAPIPSSAEDHVDPRSLPPPQPPASAAEFEHNFLQRQGVTIETDELSGCVRFFWSVDARKLSTTDQQIASPHCDFRFPSRKEPANFKIFIKATEVSMSKRGASFQKSKGKGHINLKCLQGAMDCTIPFKIWIGTPISATCTRRDPQGQIQGLRNFSQTSVIWKSQHEWDFQRAVDKKTSSFVVCAEIFTDEAAHANWYYLDSTGQEFGPFPAETMRDWFRQGLFPIGEELQVRLPAWKQHVPLRAAYADISRAFITTPDMMVPIAQAAGKEGMKLA